MKIAELCANYDRCATAELDKEAARKKLFDYVKELRRHVLEHPEQVLRGSIIEGCRDPGMTGILTEISTRPDDTLAETCLFQYVG